MKIYMKADSANGTHTKFTIFMNGVNCGQLTMFEKEALFFHELVMRSKWILQTDKIYTSGIWFLKKKENL